MPAINSVGEIPGGIFVQYTTIDNSKPAFMKPTVTYPSPIICLLSFALLPADGFCQADSVLPSESNSAVIKDNITNASPKASKRTLNFFIISKPRKLLDPATRFNILRAKLKSLFKPRQFVCIVAGSSEEMYSKVRGRLQKYDASIGSIWFDSHGSYKKGYSFFTIGREEFSYKNIFDSAATASFQKLKPFCTRNTHIGIGSCYGGATYNRPESETFKENRMNGDSLMYGMGRLFPTATVYACESWVMTKPGLFKERFAMAGAPLRKKFRDTVFEPVWQRLGVWNSYRGQDNSFSQVYCIKLDRNGNIGTRFNHYQSKKKVKKLLTRSIRKLKPNLLKV